MRVAHFRYGADSEKLAMSTMGPLCPEFPTQEETLEEVWDARRVLQ